MGYSKCSNNIFGVLLLFCLLGLGSAAEAQGYFNKLYPNHSKAMIFQASCPQGAHGFMSVAMVVDSLSNRNGLRFFRFDGNGTEQASSFFELPPVYSSDFNHYLFPGCLTRVHDNQYVALAEISSSRTQPIGCLISIDSNCNLIGFKELLNPYPGPKDTFLRSAGIYFDGTHLVTMHNTFWGGSTTKAILMKHDVTLNLLWTKLYSIGKYSHWEPGAITGTADGYVVAGVSDNLLYEDDFRYRANAIVFKTDTAGNLVWTYTCRESISTMPTSIVQTADKGFAFCTKGNVWYQSGPPYKSYVGQDKLYKIDSAGKDQWNQVIRPKISTVGPTSQKLLSEGSMLRTFYGGEDSITMTHYIGFLDTRQFDLSGKLLKQQKYYSPLVKDTTFMVLMGFFGPCRTADGGSLISGYYRDYSGKVMNPEQQGWIIKLDSNGCMGPGDPQCDPVSVSEYASEQTLLQVYPNPTSGIVQLLLSPGSAGQLELYDFQGRLLQQLSVRGGSEKMDLSAYRPGMYFYVFRDEQGAVQSGKIVYAP